MKMCYQPVSQESGRHSIELNLTRTRQIQLPGKCINLNRQRKDCKGINKEIYPSNFRNLSPSFRCSYKKNTGCYSNIFILKYIYVHTEKERYEVNEYVVKSIKTKL